MFALDDPEFAAAAAGRSTDEILHEVLFFNSIEETADGQIIRRVGARFPEREPVEVERPTDRIGGAEAIAPEIYEWLDTGDPTSRVDVWLTFDVGELPERPVFAVERGILDGLVLTDEDAWRTRQEQTQLRRAVALEALAPAFQALDALGAELIDQVPTAGTVRVVLSVDALHEVLTWADVTAAEPDRGPDTGDAGHAYFVDADVIDGWELMDLLQSDQFYQNGYFGNPSEKLIYADDGGDDVYRTHVGFDDNNGIDRFSNCTGTGTSCADNPANDPASHHPTGAASILIGDVTRGQDSALTCNPTTHNCAMRSGVARRTQAMGLEAGHSWGHLHWAATTFSYILSQSSTGGGDAECSGAVARTRTWNAMFEEGVALFNSDGNNDDPDPTWDCRVQSPATAMGVFPVSAYSLRDPNDIEVVHNSASRGGTPTEGVRSIKGMLGPSGMQYAYPHYGSACCGGYGYDPGMTGIVQAYSASSAATPAVAGSAALFRQYFRAELGTEIDDPGILYASMLLMGDRSDSANLYTKLNSGISSLTGAGRLRLRKFDQEGLDSPAAFATGSTCVGSGAAVTLDDTVSTLDADVGYVKAVIWTYDERHDNSGNGHGEFDRVSLSLQRYDTNLLTWIGIRTSAAADNQQRVYYEEPGNWRVRIRATGTAVTQDNGGCGNNSIRVYWAWLWEDNDRDDDTYMATYLRPEYP